MMNNENVTIERMVAGGDGLARLADGRVVFVDGAITCALRRHANSWLLVAVVAVGSI
jgi:hypothetical protein